MVSMHRLHKLDAMKLVGGEDLRHGRAGHYFRFGVQTTESGLFSGW